MYASGREVDTTRILEAGGERGRAGTKVPAVGLQAIAYRYPGIGKGDAGVQAGSACIGAEIGRRHRDDIEIDLGVVSAQEQKVP